MRRYKILLAGIFCVFFLAGNLFAQESVVKKIATVNLNQLFNDYDKTKAYDKKLEAEQKVKESARAKKIDEVKALQQKQALASEKDKEKIQAQIDDKMKSLQEFDRAANTDLRKIFDEYRIEILKDIEKSIRDFSVKEGFTIIFNERYLLYSDEQLDVTPMLLKIINDKYTGKKK
jgi:Outer membrane protein